MVGREVVEAVGRTHEVVGLDHAALDVGDRDAVLGAIGSIHPDAIVHCAAMTAVDACETETRSGLPRQRARRALRDGRRPPGRRVHGRRFRPTTCSTARNPSRITSGTPRTRVGVRTVEVGRRVRGRPRMRGRAHVVGHRPLRRQHGEDDPAVGRWRRAVALRRRPARLPHRRGRPRHDAAHVRRRTPAGNVARHEPRRR